MTNKEIKANISTILEQNIENISKFEINRIANIIYDEIIDDIRKENKTIKNAIKENFGISDFDNNLYFSYNLPVSEKVIRKVLKEND